MVNLNDVRDEIKEYAPSVELMAVSKTHPYEAVLECYDLGQRLFGENRVQEVAEKFPPKADRPEGMYVALIGHLQSNKVRKVLPLVDRIDSVDSIALMDKLERELSQGERILDILFEVNASGEAQKSGFESDDALFEAVKHLPEVPHLKLRGLMTVGPLGNDRDANIRCFSHVRQLYDKIRDGYGISLDILSMGMSGDWKEACDCGSTEVRIGTAIFGKRSYNV